MENINITRFTYEDNSISFSDDENIMVNATEMAKPFGKITKDWLRTNSSKEFLNVLSKRRNLPLNNLVTVKYGGDNPGTWMHRDVAIEFARWLSPEFAIWCNDIIFEITENKIRTALLPTTTDEQDNSSHILFYEYGRIDIPKDEHIKNLKRLNSFLQNEFEAIGDYYNDIIEPMKLIEFVQFINRTEENNRTWTEEKLKHLLYTWKSTFFKNENDEWTVNQCELRKGNYTEINGELFISFKEQLRIIKKLDLNYHYDSIWRTEKTYE